jgi:hypothetical protein
MTQDRQRRYRIGQPPREDTFFDGPWFKVFVALCVVAAIVGIAAELYVLLAAGHWLFTH